MPPAATLTARITEALRTHPRGLNAVQITEAIGFDTPVGEVFRAAKAMHERGDVHIHRHGKHGHRTRIFQLTLAARQRANAAFNQPAVSWDAPKQSGKTSAFQAVS